MEAQRQKVSSKLKSTRFTKRNNEENDVTKTMPITLSQKKYARTAKESVEVIWILKPRVLRSSSTNLISYNSQRKLNNYNNRSKVSENNIIDNNKSSTTSSEFQLPPSSKKTIPKNSVLKNSFTCSPSQMWSQKLEPKLNETYIADLPNLYERKMYTKRSYTTDDNIISNVKTWVHNNLKSTKGPNERLSTIDPLKGLESRLDKSLSRFSTDPKKNIVNTDEQWMNPIYSSFTSLSIVKPNNDSHNDKRGKKLTLTKKLIDENYRVPGAEELLDVYIKQMDKTIRTDNKLRENNKQNENNKPVLTLTEAKKELDLNQTYATRQEINQTNNFLKKTIIEKKYLRNETNKLSITKRNGNENAESKIPLKVPTTGKFRKSATVIENCSSNSTTRKSNRTNYKSIIASLDTIACQKCSMRNKLTKKSNSIKSAPNTYQREIGTPYKLGPQPEKRRWIKY